MRVFGGGFSPGGGGSGGAGGRGGGETIFPAEVSGMTKPTTSRCAMTTRVRKPHNREGEER